MARKLSALRRDVELLRVQFLPDKFDSLGVYPDPRTTQARTRAFLVLSHAELESYFEDWAKELTRASEKVWEKTRRITLPLAFLLSWNNERLAVPEKLGSSGSAVGTQRLEQITMQLFLTFYTCIKRNNGLKEKNILALFSPLGVPASAFTAAIMPNLDELGAIRGTHAHGAQKAVLSVLDPETEYERINTILKDLEIFEAALIDYRRVIR